MTVTSGPRISWIGPPSGVPLLKPPSPPPPSFASPASFVSPASLSPPLALPSPPLPPASSPPSEPASFVALPPPASRWLMTSPGAWYAGGLSLPQPMSHAAHTSATRKCFERSCIRSIPQGARAPAFSLQARFALGKRRSSRSFPTGGAHRTGGDAALQVAGGHRAPRHSALSAGARGVTGARWLPCAPRDRRRTRARSRALHPDAR